MAKDPAFLFYSQDFFLGVSTMDYEDRGKYITILCVMHQQGRLTEQSIRLLVGSISDTLKSKFKIDSNDRWYNKRLEEEIEKRKMFVNSRKINGSKGGRPKSIKPNAKPNGKPSAKASENLIEDEDENENKISFNVFWEAYDKKVGQKSKIKRRWDRLPENTQLTILKHIELYKRAQPNKRYRKNPETYFNNESWNDEIIEDKNGIYSKHLTEDKLRTIANDIANDPDLK